eukprot:3499863-Prymnesium_polylepis.2
MPYPSSPTMPPNRQLPAARPHHALHLDSDQPCSQNQLRTAPLVGGLISYIVHSTHRTAAV